MDNIEQLLTELEACLKQKGYWLDIRPNPAAFNSCVPFFADAMDFNQWLQFVFIEKVRGLILNGGNLPKGAHLESMAVDFYPQDQDIISIVKRLDRSFK